MEIMDLRKAIDEIDDEMLALYMKRLHLVEDVAAYKRDNQIGIRNRKREREVLSRICEKAGEYDVYASMLFHTMFDTAVSHQISLLMGDSALAKQIREAVQETPKLFPTKGMIACQGVEGAYSQIACDRLFPMANIMYFSSFESVFSAVESGLCKYGVLPLENSSNGTVSEVYDLMQSKNFHIVRSLRLQVNHALLVKPGVKLSDIKEIVSHQQAIGQCSAFLKGLDGVRVTACENTAIAAAMVADSDSNQIAAISSTNCAELYGLEVLDYNVQNSDNNNTRFICIAKELEVYPGANKISVMLTLPHEPGSLYHLIGQFSAMGINLLKLESRPVPGEAYAFMFYFDFEASVHDDRVVALLSMLKERHKSFSFLGNYQEM